MSDESCKAGIHNFFLEANGNVKICFNMPPIGNIRENTPEEIWKSERADRIRDAIAKCTKDCKMLNCNYYEE